MLGLSDSVWKFSQTWVWLSMVIYVLALGLSHGVLIPAVKRMGVLMHEMAAGPPPVGGPRRRPRRWRQLGQKMGVVGPILDLASSWCSSSWCGSPGVCSRQRARAVR